MHEDGKPDPGKAVVVLQIDDPAFQDFRQDASCLIRPQSLLGEKFVECKPTQPRAPGIAGAAPARRIPDGQPGAGQHLLPLEHNGKAVDLDLVNNIMREPYADRFRLILNDLGAGLAARGDELAEIVERAEPGAARDQPGARDPRPAEPGARRARPRRRHGARRRWPREREHIAGLHQQRRHGRRRRPPSAAATSRRGFAKLPRLCASCARR